MFLRNHGLVVCGKSIEDTFALLTTIMDAVKTQVRNLNILTPPPSDTSAHLTTIVDAVKTQVQL